MPLSEAREPESCGVSSGQTVSGLLPLQFYQLGSEKVEPLCPGNLFEFTRTAWAAALERLLYPVRVIEFLHYAPGLGRRACPG